MKLWAQPFGKVGLKPCNDLVRLLDPGGGGLSENDPLLVRSCTLPTNE